MIKRRGQWGALAALSLTLAGCGSHYELAPAAPSPVASATLSATPDHTPTASAKATSSFTQTAPSATHTAAATQTVTPSRSLTPTARATSTATASATAGIARVEIGGAVHLRFETATSELTLWRGDTQLLSFPADAVQLGRVDALDDAFNYDPYQLYVPSGLYQPPAGLRWLAVTSAQIGEVGSDSFSVDLDFEGGRKATLSAIQSASGRFRLHLAPAAEGDALAYFRLRPHVDASEGFYGLGEYFDDVNHRGKLRAMQIEFDGDLESSYNEAHVPVPLVIGTRGWGWFVESFYPGVFDVARQAADRIEAAFGTGLASQQGLTFHLFAAAHPLDLTKHYYEVTGYPRLPADWALGPWIWRDENRDQQQFEDDLNTIRDLDLATSAVWIDRPYATAVNTFDFNPPQFPDPPHMIDLAHRLGMRLGLWHTPYLDRSAVATKELRDYATAHSFYPPHTSLLFNNWGRPLDFTNPEAFAWWQSLIHRYTDIGIEGFKLDYGEDIAVGLSSGRNVWRFADGSDERTMHARYQLLYHRVYAETLPASGGFLLCRHATIGDQLNGPIIWPGDLDASFAKHRETVGEGERSYVAVGGLPAAMIAGIGLGASGFPFYGADTGGYRHSPPDKELFTRWFEQTALSSVMQIGTSTNDVAWEPTAENGFDAEMLDWYRRYTRLHLRLFPYEWTYAQRIAQDGRPIQRPFGLAYPELGVHPWDQYMFGDDLLVAPVVERGQRQRQVYFPPGEWLDWWTGQAYSGPGAQTFAAPLDTLPLFQRAGSIVPLLRPSIDTLSPTQESARVDSFANNAGVLYARVAGCGGSFALYDGSSLSSPCPSPGEASDHYVFAYTPGTVFTAGVIFARTVGAAQFPPETSRLTEDGVALARFNSLAELEESDAGWFYDGTLYIKVGAGEHHLEILASR